MKIECNICGARMGKGTLPEHYKEHHPEAYQQYLKNNADIQVELINHRQLRKFNRKEF